MVVSRIRSLLHGLVGCSIISMFLSCGSGPAELQPASDSFDLFRNTLIAELANATQRRDTTRMNELVLGDGLDVNAAEPMFGGTLLMLCVRHADPLMVRHLLKLGADTKPRSRWQGSTALTYAASLGADDPAAEEIIHLLLVGGADPDLVEGCEDIVERCLARSPLIVVCSAFTNGPDVTRRAAALVEAGADVNYRDHTKRSALHACLTFEHFDAALYLIDHGSDPRMPLSSFDGQEIQLTELLRASMVDLGSEAHRQKMAFVQALKARGVDYALAPVPDHIVDRAKALYPDDWSEYIKAY